MNIVCLDLEGVLVPEIWIAFSEASGIPELRKTTRDEPDYDKLMKWRLGILKEHGLGLRQIQETIAKLEEATKNNTGLHFQVAINYGSRDEMLRAMNRIIEDRDKGIINDSGITRELFESYLDTAGIPDPDLLIRTSGEQRLSNYLLWQLAYAEFYFTDVHWPDFGAEELEKAIEAYNKRERRFGGV